MKSENSDAKLIFDEALRLSVAAERRAFLDRACAGNQALREEVESLLKAYDQAGDFFNRTMPLPEPDIALERPGTLIGRYKLLEQIGEGGFGTVYMAEQVEPVQRKVALKIIKAGMDTKEVIARFEAERQALALMDHPNIAKVLDAGATTSGRPYFVMELVRGLPITDYCDYRLLSTAERLHLFIGVCHAIQHAHQKGIIHRDLKPSNIMVTLHDGVPVPKVIDFGVAKALGQKLIGKTLFTRFAQMVGTPAYMSPEQAELSGLDIDTRSDIYSLGVLLYELTTGVTPFDKETLAKAALDEIRRMIRESEPPKPSVRVQTLGAQQSEVAERRKTEPIALSRLLRGDLDWIVMKCLEKDRQRRYETPGALAQDVARHLNCQPVLASPPSAAYLLAKFVRRHRVGVSVVSMFVLALLAGLGSTLIALRRARQEQARAAAAAMVATTIGDTIQRAMLGEVGEPARTNGALPSRAMLDQLAGNIQGQFHDKPLVEAAVRLAMGRTYISLGDYAVGERQIQRAAEIRQKELGPENPDTLEALGALGFLWFKQGKPGQAEAQLRRVLESQRRVLGQEDPATIQTLVMLTAVQRPGGEASLTPDLLKTIRSMRSDDPRTLRALHSVVDTLRSEKQLLDAATLGRELMARQERVLGSNHTETVRGMLCLSYTLEALGRTNECEQLRREALRRGRQTDPTSPDTVAAFRRLMELIMQRQDYPEAQRLLEGELEIEKRLLGAGHTTTLLTEQSLVRVAQQNASASAAKSQRRDQLAGAEERIRRDNSDPSAWLQRALARADLGDWNSATEDFDQAVSRLNLAKTPVTAGYAWDCLKLANVALAAAQHKTAERISREALRVFKDLEGKDAKDPNHALGAGKSLWALADALMATQRSRDAKQILDEAMGAFKEGAVRSPENPELRQEQAFTHRKLAAFHEAAGERQDTERHYRIAIESYAALEKEFPTNTWYAKEEAFTTWQLAGALYRSGSSQVAEVAYRRAIDLYEQGAVRFPNEQEFNLRSRAIRRELATLFNPLPATNQVPIQPTEVRNAKALDKVIVRQPPLTRSQELLRKGDIKGAVEMFRLAEQPGLQAVRNPQNAHLYRRLNEPMSWSDGKAFCAELGGHLATATSQEENDFIYQNFASDHVCWLGASDETKEGDWQWVTGEPFIYTNWFRGEPNNDKGEEHFLAMGNHPTLAYRFGPSWNDHEVTGTLADGPTFYPICEWDAPLPGVTVVEPVQMPAPPQPKVLAPRVVPAGELESGSMLRPPSKAALGQRAPPVSLHRLEGGEFDLTVHFGTNIVLLAFWATWSPDCGTTIPVLASLGREYRSKGVVLYAVNLNEPADRIRAFLQKSGCDLEVLLDQEGSVADSYGIKGLTSIAVIGKDGRVWALHTQTKPDLKDSLKQELDTLLAGKTLAQPAASAPEVNQGPEPSDADAWFTRGAALNRMGQLAEACDAFSKSLKAAAARHDTTTRTQALLARAAVLKQLNRASEAQADFLEAKGIPPRPSKKASSYQIDLTQYFNASLDEDWHLGPIENNDLAGLPRGLQRFAKADFDVRGIVQLEGNNLAGRFPRTVRISIARRSPRLHFLHGVAWNTRDGTQVGAFVFHYADGAEATKPIIYGQDVRDWWHYPGTPLEVSEATVAWRGTNSALKDARANIPSGSAVRLYESQWQNPRPETEIVSLDYFSSLADATAPFLIGITVE